MFGNARTLDAPDAGRSATNALETLRLAAAAVLAHNGAPHGDARKLAFEIWSMSHGVAMLALSGHLDPDAKDGCSPEDILSDTAAALVEAAVRRATPAPRAVSRAD
jgi:hypothetical protein